jgi:hypothetical protein
MELVFLPSLGSHFVLTETIGYYQYEGGEIRYIQQGEENKLLVQGTKFAWNNDDIFRNAIMALLVTLQKQVECK